MLLIVAIVVAVVALFAVRRLSADSSDPRLAQAARSARSVLVLAVAVAAIVAFVQLARIVPAGHVGVVDPFGQVSPNSHQSGLRLVNPLAKVEICRSRRRRSKRSWRSRRKRADHVARGRRSLPSGPDESARGVSLGRNELRPGPARAKVPLGGARRHRQLRSEGALHLGARAHGRVAHRRAERTARAARHHDRDLSLEKVGLPTRLAQAIEEELSAEQESQRMRFVLQKEQHEAERKPIEAGGIADFQKIVSQGISEQLLRWKGLEATLEIAKSPKAKVVVVGSGKDGLPIILGNQ